MKFPSNSLTFLRRFIYGTRLRPARDWFVLIVATSILLVASVAWNVFVFRTTITDQATVGVPVRAGQSVNRTTLQRMQQIFNARAIEQEKYQTGAYVFRDPSR
ncbi:MAG TPA: hypothetical protein VF829_00155 [Candidatus Paceibacterota bacterium]